ncbi:MAG: hypothetical protein K6B74_08485 [Ruminococcus sp.]|nr:hypothetical protein [Ruminococcus sp.]
MKGALLKLRVLTEGFFLWFGGLGLFYMLMLYIEPHTDSIRAQDMLHVTTVAVLLAAAIWLLVSRRKELGERISSAAYVILSVIPLIIGTASVLLYIFSLD